MSIILTVVQQAMYKLADLKINTALWVSTLQKSVKLLYNTEDSRPYTVYNIPLLKTI